MGNSLKRTPVLVQLLTLTPTVAFAAEHWAQGAIDAYDWPGGVADTYSGVTIRSCIALNKRITMAYMYSGSYRVVSAYSSDVFSNLYAWNGILVGESGHEATRIRTDNTRRDGADLTSAEVMTQNKWETAGFTFATAVDAVWTWDATGQFMPSLHGEEIPWPSWIDNDPNKGTA